VGKKMNGCSKEQYAYYLKLLSVNVKKKPYKTVSIKVTLSPLQMKEKVT